MLHILAIITIFSSHQLWRLCIPICPQVLTVLCNVAEKGPAYCQHLWPGPLLSSLLGMLALSDTEVVGQSLELLQLLFLYRPEVGFRPCSPILTLKPLASPWPPFLLVLTIVAFLGLGNLCEL